MSSQNQRRQILSWFSLAAFVATLTASILTPVTAQAAPISVSGSLNVTATVLPNPPTSQAVIIQPASGTRVQTTPIVLQGTCGPDLLVRVFNNDVLAGSITCSPQGDFVMNITLKIGENVLKSLNFDAFEQVGPSAPSVTIFVDEPTLTSEPDDQTIINQDGTITLTSDASPSTGLNADYQRLFEGTVVEPLAKALDVSTVVSPGVNTAVAIATNGLFVLAVIALLFILLL